MTERNMRDLYPPGVTVWECPNECRDPQLEPDECPTCGEELLPFTALYVGCEHCGAELCLNEAVYVDGASDGAVPVTCEECGEFSGHYVRDYEEAERLELAEECDGSCHECGGTGEYDDGTTCEGCHGSGCCPGHER